MAFDLSFGSLASARERLRSTYNKYEYVTSRLLGTAETGVGAFGAAYLQKKYPDYEMVKGIDTALLGGIALNLVGYLDKGAGWGKHACHVGNGVLAVYLTKYAWNMASQSGSTSTSTGGLLPAPAPGFHVGAQELANAGW